MPSYHYIGQSAKNKTFRRKGKDQFRMVVFTGFSLPKTWKMQPSFRFQQRIQAACGNRWYRIPKTMAPHPDDISPKIQSVNFIERLRKK